LDDGTLGERCGPVEEDPSDMAPVPLGASPRLREGGGGGGPVEEGSWFASLFLGERGDDAVGFRTIYRRGEGGLRLAHATWYGVARRGRRDISSNS